MSTALSKVFGFFTGAQASDELPDIYPFPMLQSEFVKCDVVNIYAKILTDVVERTHGLGDDEEYLLWDNCLKSQKCDGLVTLLAKAMSDRQDLFLVFDRAAGILRKADQKEQQQIRLDYDKQAESEVGIYISFKEYYRTDMIKLYSALEYSAVGSLYKTMKLSNAVQLKFTDLRASVNAADKDQIVVQAQALAASLNKGRPVALDAKDIVDILKPDLAATNSAMSFLNEKRAFYLGMPASYITGIQTGGIGSTGEADTKATERGLKNYYFSIIKPVLEDLFDLSVSYKSQDFRQVTQGLEALKTFSLVDDSLISHENKQTVINQLFDFDTDGGSDETGTKAIQPANPVQQPVQDVRPQAKV